MARRVGRAFVARGAAVLLVVGLCLPLLFWLFGEGEAPAPARGAQQARVPTDQGAERVQAPERGEPGPTAPPSAAAEAGAEERPRAPGPLGPEPAWADPETWNGRTPQAPDAAAVYSATISGRVLDPQGHPVAGVRVSPSSAGLGSLAWGELGSRPQEGVPSALSGEDGRFRLEVSGDHYLPAQLSLAPPLTTDLLPKVFDVSLTHQSGNDAHHVGELTLSQGGRIEGRVCDTSGRPLAGVKVRLQRGAIEFDRLLKSLDIVVLEDFVEFDGWEDSGASSPNLIDTRGWNMGRSSASSVVFLSGGRGGSSVSSADAGPSTTSRADGSFVLRQVESSPAQTLVARREGYAVLRRDGIQVQAGRATRGVELRLARGPVLEVTVLDPRGVPIQGARVSVSDDEGGSFTAISDAQGHVRTRPLTSPRLEVDVSAAGRRSATTALSVPPGSDVRTRVTLSSASGISYQLPGPGSSFAIRRGGEGILQPDQRPGGVQELNELLPGRYDLIYNDHEGLACLARDLVVREGERLELGKLIPTPLAPARVRVLDAEGRPVPGATLTAQDSSLGEAATDESGEALVTLWPGDHTYRVSAYGHKTTSCVLSEGQALTLRLTPSDAYLHVRSEGQDVRTLTLRREGRSVTSYTFAHRVRIPLPGPGRYGLEVDGLAYGEVSVTAGQELEFLIREPTLVEYELTFLGPAGRPLAGAEVALTTTDPRLPGASPQFDAGTPGQSYADAGGRVQGQLLCGPGTRELFARVVSRGQVRVLRVSRQGNRIQSTLRLPSDARAHLEVEAGGAADPGSQVQLVPLTAPGARTLLATLDASARARFSSVLLGRYQVVLSEGGERLEREVEVGPQGATLTLAR